MFQARFEVLHRPHLSPWTCALWPSVIHSAAFLQWFSFPSVSVDPCLREHSCSCDDLERSLTRFCCSTFAESSCESGVARVWVCCAPKKEVQQVVAAGWHAKMNEEVLAYEIGIFRLFWSDLSVRLVVVVQLMVMTDS